MALTGPQCIALEWFFFFISFLCVLLRQYLRFLRNGRFTMADVFVGLGCAFFIAQTSMDTALLGLGMFDDKIAPGADKYGPGTGLATFAETKRALKILYVETSIYYTMMYCIKCSMLCFYKELFPKSLRALRIALTITMIFTTLSLLVSLVVKLFICEPLYTNWDPDHYCDASSSMTSTSAAIISNSTEWALHCATDVFIYILPLFLLRRLQLPLLQKIGVGLTFSAGFICIVFANVFQVSILRGAPNTQVWLYAALEQSWALIVVCCPSFKQLLTRKGFRRAFRGKIGSSSTDPSSGHYDSRSGVKTTGTTRSGIAKQRIDEESFARKSTDEIANSKEEPREYAIEVSYEMEARTASASTRSAEGVAQNVSTSAWSTV